MQDQQLHVPRKQVASLLTGTPLAHMRASVSVITLAAFSAPAVARQLATAVPKEQRQKLVTSLAAAGRPLWAGLCAGLCSSEQRC